MIIAISIKFLLCLLFLSPFFLFFPPYNLKLFPELYLLLILKFLSKNFSHLSQSPYCNSFVAGISGAAVLLCASQFSEVPVLTLPLCAVMCLCGQFVTANAISRPYLFFSYLFILYVFACLFFPVLPVVVCCGVFFSFVTASKHHP